MPVWKLDTTQDLEVLGAPAPVSVDLETKDDAPPTVSGIAAAFGNIDQVHDVIEKGAFRATLRERSWPVAFLWQHNIDEPIGVIRTLRETDKGLHMEAELSLETQRGREARALAKMGAVQGLSIGFRIPPGGANYEQRAGREVRVIKQIDLVEVSLVTVPANQKALVTGVKAVVPFGDLPLAPRDRAWSASAAIRRVRAWAGAEDEPNARYRRAFLWYDAENANEFGAYKLPIADVIDGTLTAVPRAIFAAAAVMQGSRGGVDIPDSDRPGVRRVIARYYAKMREQFDDESLMPPWEKGGPGPDEYKALAQSIEDKRECEQYLIEVGFSRRVAKALVSTWVEAVAGRDDGDVTGDAGAVGHRDGGSDEVHKALAHLVSVVRSAAGKEPDDV